MNRATVAFILAAIAVLCTLVNIALLVKKETRYPIVGKYEHNGKCYLAVEIEITPEEFIGYDINDDYSSNKFN